MTRLKLVWTSEGKVPETCGHTRPRGKVRCELPPGHRTDDGKWFGEGHLGRGRIGQWLSWR